MPSALEVTTSVVLLPLLKRVLLIFLVAQRQGDLLSSLRCYHSGFLTLLGIGMTWEASKNTDSWAQLLETLKQYVWGGSYKYVFTFKSSNEDSDVVSLE